MMLFVGQGFRVIAHDRRGHGRSTQVATGHDMDTYVADVTDLTDALDLKGARLKSSPGYPHGMPTTHADVINADLLTFINS